MKNSHSVSSYVLSLSYFALAGALVYFAYVLSAVVAEIPKVVDELSSVLIESKSIVQGIEKIQKSIPAILDESARIRAEISPYAGILTNGVSTIDKALVEIDKSRSALNSFTEELGKTRKEIPTLLKSADNLVSHAKEVGEDMSQGAAIGAVKGILESPFAIVDDLAKKLYDLKPEDADKKSNGDFTIIEQAALTACHSNHTGTVVEWYNPKTTHHGTVTLKAIQDDEYQECRIIAIKSGAKESWTIDKQLTFCRKAGGPWHFQK